MRFRKPGPHSNTFVSGSRLQIPFPILRAITPVNVRMNLLYSCGLGISIAKCR